MPRLSDPGIIPCAMFFLKRILEPYVREVTPNEQAGFRKGKMANKENEKIHEVG